MELTEECGQDSQKNGMLYCFEAKADKCNDIRHARSGTTLALALGANPRNFRWDPAP